ncbi:Arrestin-N domain-containing protein [Mycena sanguinolenta]|uniref:Arrestin-N domain-containing protein n=1 Tax=Mycena sanguinolenta TaxID=230812 RepID=A0A8H6Y2Z6_9AGAR|nr:Arrestin-N domain-containing protein [Mycena sanguinolenta]
MAPQNNDTSPAFVLYFPDAVRVAGETIQGRVELNVALAQDEGIEDLHVNLRGSIVTTIIESNFDGSNTKHERAIELINSEKLLWERGTAFPDPGSHILVLPFKFKLPTDLPPSFHLCVLHHEAIISYTLEVVGSRPGLFRKDHLVRKIFPVLPAASPTQVLAKKSLKRGWNGVWKTISIERKIRQGIWGDHSHARIEVKIPDLESFPRATALPLTLCIETRTKSMARTNSPEDKPNKPMFPAPPTQTGDVELFFEREASIRAQRQNGTAIDSFRTYGAFGDPSNSVQSAIEAEWIPDPERQNYGVWKRTVRFETKVTLPFAPTFSTETIECKYFLNFAVAFPGMGNNVELHVPIQLDPAHACPSFAMNYADVPPEGPPPPLDELPPPAYSTRQEISIQ